MEPYEHEDYNTYIELLKKKLFIYEERGRLKQELIDTFEKVGKTHNQCNWAGNKEGMN